MRQEVMFTACPKERVTGGLIVSVVISPRLDPEGDPQALSTFRDFVDWPSQALRWGVSVDDSAPIVATVESGAPRSDLWTGLFAPTTLVRGPAYPNYAQHVWHSYPVGHIVDFIHKLYQDVAIASPTEHPDVSLLDDSDLSKVSHLNERGLDKRPELRERYLTRLKANRALPPSAPDPEADFYQLYNFHLPGSLKTPPTPPTFDFHEVVALCGEHFELLRRLGLVVDLLVRGTFPNGNTTLRIHPTWTSALGANSVDIQPITHCVLTNDTFLTAPKDPEEIVNGRLPLDGPRYRVVQVDPDGGAINLMTLARNRVFAKLFPSEDTPQQETLPALRAGGISIARTGHAEQLVEHVDANAQLHTLRTAGDIVNLYAEDLWHGTRFDVWDAASAQWHSLQQRRGSYHFVDLNETVEIGEEGVMVETPTERDEEGENTETGPAFHLQESLMRWDGWSLAAPRPGRTLNEQDQVIPEPETTSAGYPLRMRFKAEPGSLPRLRYGVRYQIRGRVVDPAGNSVPFDSDDSNAVTTLYLRYQPVPTPFVLLTAPRTEGESDAQPVLRSNYNTPPAPATVERIIAPPRAAQLTAEQHGMWDQAWANPAATYAQIVAKEDRGFHVEGFGVPDPDGYDQPYFPQKPVPVTYLPDPMARGAAFRFYPDTGVEPFDVLVPFDSTDPWPEARVVRLIAREGTGQPEVVNTNGEVELIYRMGKADTVRVRVSSYVHQSDLSLSSIWQLIQSSSATAAQKETWRDLATKGRLWMLTPYRTLTLVHAVRQPLKPPSFQGLSTNRQAGTTYIDLNGLMNFSRKSTSRMDLQAHWKEPVDLGPGGGVPAEPPLIGDDMQEHEEWLELPLLGVTGIDTEDFMAIENRRQEFFDTKRRIITYAAKATTKFSEFFQERQKGVPLVTNEVIQLSAVPLVEGSDLVRLPEDGPSFERGVAYDIDYDNAELTWKAANATVDIVFLAEPISRMSEEAEDAATRAVTLDIPSSARPRAPKILYAIPTYRWQSQLAASSAKGGGLRIYLDRPFYETGEGQLLGVVLDPTPNNPAADLANFVTRWGFDPIQGPPAPPTKTPRHQDFTMAAPGGVGMGRTLAENGKTVNVVGHAVGFDTARNLYYCDIEVNPGNAHAPFIRLALASYQPISVHNLHLSPVVRAEIMQLTPDRTATFQITSLVGGKPGVVAVDVLGTSPPPNPGSPLPTLPQVIAYVEQRNPNVVDDLLAWEASPGEDKRVVLQPEDESDGLTRWRGQLVVRSAMSSSIAQDDPPLRIVIEEWQIVPESEDDSFVSFVPRLDRAGTPETSGMDAPAQTEPDEHLPQLGRRLLYRDVLPLEDEE